MSEEEKAKETNELKAEQKQLQRKIETAEDTQKKEELKELMSAEETLVKMSTVNEARERLTSEISLKTSQYEPIFPGVETRSIRKKKLKS